MIELKNIRKIYNKKNEALKDVNLKFDTTGMVFVVGKSGSGKSTLLNIIGLLDTYESGEYLLLNKSVSGTTLEEQDHLRNHYFGFVFQDYLLLENMNVYENVAFALDLQSQKDDELVIQTLSDLDILDLKDRKINELSGGQAQRVAIARALVKRPSVILADEPTGNLDEESRKSIYQLLKKLSENYLVIVVSHDSIASVEYASRIIKLDSGCIISDLPNNCITYTIEGKDLVFKDISKETLIRVVDEREDLNNITISKHKLMNNNTKEVVFDDANKKDTISNKTVMKYVKSSFTKEKGKNIITSFFLALTFSVLLLLLFIVNYNASKTMNAYIDKYDISEFGVYKDIVYVDDFYVTNNTTIYKGSQLKNAMLEAFNQVYECKEGYISYNEVDKSTNVRFKELGIDNSIEITDYLASSLSVTLNEYVELFNNSYKVTKIIDTDYESYNLLDKIADERYSAYAMNKLKYQYNVCYIAKNEVTEIFGNDAINVQSSDFYKSTNYESYFNSNVSYNTINGSTYSIISGRTPNNSNEVIVSSTFLANHFNESYDPLNKTFYFKNLNDSKYKGYYDDRINMNNFYESGIKIVGVYDGDSDVLINDKVYQELKKEYIYGYVFDYFIGDNIKKNGIEFLSKNSILIDEVNFTNIYNSMEFIKEVSLYIKALLVIFVLITLFSIVNYVYTKIKEKNKQIGIMKALGVRNGDIMKLILYEIFIMMIISSLVSIIVYGIVLNVLNFKFKSSILEMPFDLIYVDWFTMPFGLLCILLLFVISAFVFVVKIANRKPMNSIRN